MQAAIALIAASVLIAVAVPAASAASALTWGKRIQVNFDPAGDPTSNTNTNYGLNTVSCTTPRSCAAVDSHGKVFYSTNPGGGSSAWKSKTIDSGHALKSISCLPSLCVAGDFDGNIMVSTNPFSSTPSWSAPAGIGSGSLNSISCPSTTLCVAVGVGEVITSTDPVGGTSKWTAVPVDGVNALEAVSCPTTSFCEAVDLQGNSVSSTDPIGGSSKWIVHSNVDTNQHFQSLSCPSSSLCVGIDTAGDDGHIATSTSPASDTAWKTVNVEPAMSFRYVWAVNCPSVSMCVVVDDNGYAFTSTQPTGDAPAWSSVLADGRASPVAVSCSGPTLCTLVDTYGNAYVGQVPPPNTAITHSTINQHTRTATFAFTATGTASGFQCELHRAGHAASFSACSSPKTYANLPLGSYTFLVRAFNLAGPDPTPAASAFTFKVSAPPSTKITGETINKKKHSATFRFKATGPATGFRCALVKLKHHKPGKKPPKPSFSSCKSPKTYKPLKPGKYTFEVRALSAGGAGPVATKRFKI